MQYKQQQKWQGKAKVEKNQVEEVTDCCQYSRTCIIAHSIEIGQNSLWQLININIQ